MARGEKDEPNPEEGEIPQRKRNGKKHNCSRFVHKFKAVNWYTFW
jgi:hypothetical protein